MTATLSAEKAVAPATSATLRLPVLPNLTSLRIFAAAWVVLYHLYGSKAPARPWYDAWIDCGYLGVTLFFVLSGFILAYNAPLEIRTGKFYALRLARVYPLYLAAMLWTLPNLLRHHQAPLALVVTSSLLLVQSWFGSNLAMAWNSPAWSLSTEVFFYLTFPFLLPLLRRYRHRTWWPLAGFAMLAVLPASALHLWSAAHGTPLSPAMRWVVELPVVRLSEFVVGILLGLRFADRRPTFRGRTVLLWLLVSLAVIGLAAYRLPYDVVRTGLLAVPFGMLLYTLAGWQSRWLSSPIMQVLGEISYGVYLLQSPLLMTLNEVVARLHRPALVPLLQILLICPVAFLFYRLVEVPGRHLLLHLFGVRSHKKPIETTGLSLAWDVSTKPVASEGVV